MVGGQFTYTGSVAVGDMFFLQNCEQTLIKGKEYNQGYLYVDFTYTDHGLEYSEKQSRKFHKAKLEFAMP